jgi:hemoglobin-like flavoprotein
VQFRGQTMNNEDIEIVKRTLRRIVPPRPEGNSELILQRYAKILFDANKALADCFYARLFEIAPETQALFKGDMEQQKQKFVNMLALLTRSMNRLHDTLNTMQELGCTHMKAGVKITDYQPFLSALLWALREKLGEEDFNDNVAKAWVAVLSRIAGIMVNAAYPEARGISPNAPVASAAGNSAD